MECEFALCAAACALPMVANGPSVPAAFGASNFPLQLSFPLVATNKSSAKRGLAIRNASRKHSDFMRAMFLGQAAHADLLRPGRLAQSRLGQRRDHGILAGIGITSLPRHALTKNIIEFAIGDHLDLDVGLLEIFRHQLLEQIADLVGG